jgi:hypothetical protein
MNLNLWSVPKAPGTHTLMDGGILFVPDEDSDAFFQSYISQVKLGKKLYVVEQKTEVFKFFVDLDYKAQEKPSDEFIIKICEAIHEALDKPGRCCIARAQSRPVKEGIKTGVHIHWPDFKVTKPQAVSARARILLAMPDGPIDWNSVIDSSVYGGSGLRMLWSHKKPSGDPYVPWKQLDGPDFSKEPNVETLALFSMRTSIKEGRPNLFDDETPASEPIEEFIQRYIQGHRQTQVKKIQRLEAGSDAWYVQTDSKYCERIGEEHRSNHVWFLITKGRICQRCFNEECKTFSGAEHILPPSIIDEIVVVGSPPTNSFLGLLSEKHSRPVPEVRAGNSSVLWP